MDVLANTSGTTDSNQSLTLSSNLIALRSVWPDSAAATGDAVVSQDVQHAVARDGTPTFTWIDGDGRRAWLGRTTMPEIRGQALAESLAQGVGNLLIYEVGHGATARRILGRLADYQAVIVIEPDAWRMKLALSLHDFSVEIGRRRFLPFAGRDAWKQCGDFLAEHEGFLIPGRILSWPWFDREAGGHVTRQLTQLSDAVEQSRAKRRADRRTARIERSESPRIAIVSSSLAFQSHRLCRRMAEGASAAALPALCLPFDTPVMINPAAAADALRAFAPTRIYIVDGVPASLSYPLPPCEVCSVFTAGNLAGDEVLRGAGGIPILVHSDQDRRLAIERGIMDERVMHLPPSALPNIPEIPADDAAMRNEAGVRVLVLGDRIDISPEAVGLHLTSHRRLWDAARNQIERDPDGFDDEMAEKSLAAAERQMGIAIESADVRRGLADRIRAVLGPGVMQRALLAELDRKRIAYALVGHDWETASLDDSYERYRWWTEAEILRRGGGTDESPIAALSNDLIEDSIGRAGPGNRPRLRFKSGDVALFFRPTEGQSPWFLDALAAGMPGVLRCRSIDSLPSGLRNVVGNLPEVTFGWTIRDVIRAALSAAELWSAPERPARLTAARVRGEHSWSARLGQLLNGT